MGDAMAVMIINIAINGFDVSGHVEHLVAEEVNGTLLVRFDLADDELRILMGRDRAPSIPDTRRPHGVTAWPKCYGCFGKFSKCPSSNCPEIIWTQCKEETKRFDDERSAKLEISSIDVPAPPRTRK